MSDILRLKGPILVLGGGGFIGSNLLAMLRTERDDVLDGEGQGRTIFNLIGYGGHPNQTDPDTIYRTNFMMTQKLVHSAEGCAAYIHAGSSSEYGVNAAGPSEDQAPTPNSDYAASKAACASLLYYMGKHRQFPCAHLRLYSVYGPGEGPDRLIPTVIREGRKGRFPPLVHPAISRDFVYIDDVCRAFIHTAAHLQPWDYGEAFNIGTGVKTTIGDVALMAQMTFGITAPARFGTMTERVWDVREWYANPEKAYRLMGWKATTSFTEGFYLTAAAQGD